MHELNPVLMDVASWRLANEREKRSFVPAGATDPAAAAMPAGPPAGPPPGMDPMAMAGAMPPMDPTAMAGAMPPGAMPPIAGAPGAPGAPGAGGKLKVDPAFLYMELARIRKLLTHFMKHNGVDLPPDILDDGTVAQVVQGAQPQSSPIGAGGPAGGSEQGAAAGPEPFMSLEPKKQASDVLALFRAPDPALSAPDPEATERKIDALSRLSRGLSRAG